MSQVLGFGSDFIEHMSNPAYGIRVNEDYSLRFAALLSSEAFEKMLHLEVEQLNDPETLSPHGWLWLFGWARSRDISLDEKLLLQLTENWSSVFMQVATIDLATRWAQWTHRDTVIKLQAFDHPWLSKLLQKCTEFQNTNTDEVDTRLSETVLISLMQVGRDITLDAASALLHHDWIGKSRLVQFFWSLCNGLDDETRAMWVSRLRPPR